MPAARTAAWARAVCWACRAVASASACRLTDLVAVGLGGPDMLPGLSAGLGDGGVPLGSSADCLHFGFGGGRVGEGVDPVPQPGPPTR
jgi:hypothetical protein